MQIISLCPGSLGSNCYLLTANGRAFVVDPSPSVNAILQGLQQVHAEAEAILLTHGHFDHILSMDTLRQRTGLPVYLHEGDGDMPSDPAKNAFRYFFNSDRIWNPPDRLLRDGERLTLGGETIRVLHTPGHSLGSVCYLTDSGILTGDTLFADNVGRTDFYGGDSETLKLSLERLRQLNPQQRIYPGHGPSERLGNALDNAAYWL